MIPEDLEVSKDKEKISYLGIIKPNAIIWCMEIGLFC
jgi:hypothetical protein